MDAIYSSRATLAAVLGFLIPATYLFLKRIRTTYARYQLARAGNCARPRCYQKLDRLPFGIGFQRTVLGAVKQHRVPQWFDEAFRLAGKTWDVGGIFSRTVCTCDPRIVQALLGPQQFNGMSTWCM